MAEPILIGSNEHQGGAMIRLKALAATVILVLWVASASASKLDDDLDRRLRGAWATLGVEVYSSCSGTYSDNTIGAGGVSSKAARRFDAGELVKIDKIKVKRARVDLLTTLAEPVLVPHRDGPFELWDERECKAQLIFEVGRSAVKSGDADVVMRVLMSSMVSYPSREAARASDTWNGRERRPFPPGYDLTLARYEVWKAEQTNAAVAAGIDRAIDEAADAAEGIEQNADYLDGFAAGAEEMDSLDIDDCARLIDASFSSFRQRPPSGKTSTWDRGFDDGQRLVFHLYLSRELRHCFVPVTPGPIP
jgi:hypothetical protein